MKKRFLPLTIALIAPLFFMSACDSDNDLASKSAREMAKAQAEAAKCSVSLMTGSCTADGSAIATIKCNGIDLSIGTQGLCPAGTKCVAMDEGIGPMPYCVPENDIPECVISSCDAADSAKIKKCVGGKFVVEACKADEVCRVAGKDGSGKDLAASCVAKPNTETKNAKDAEDNYDPCKTSGHTATVGDACSADAKIALYTCQDGFVMMENCHPYACEHLNPKQTVTSWVAEADEMMKPMITMMAAVMPDKDVHGCHIIAGLDLMKKALLFKIELPDI